MICVLTSANAQVKCNQGNQNPVSKPGENMCPIADATPIAQQSYDPNELIGPEGYDSARWVSINDVLRYTIMFENDPAFATAAAQVVDVRFGFPSKDMMRGFGIGNYSFANQAFTVETPSNAYQRRMDLRESQGFFVDLIGGLDLVRQQGFWNFSTIDPQTGFAPTEVDKGLLPVNDSTHVGEGYVTFQLTPPEDMKTGDTISLAAKIVFDKNDTIPTNRWCVTVDAGAPTSRVRVFGGFATEKQLAFTAADDEGGSGVKHLLLYMANNMGIYEEIDTVAVDTVLSFPVEAGRQYKLYTIAVDNTGNREPAKMEPDVVLNFNTAPTDIALSDTIFQDDLAAGGYIGKLTSVDSEDNQSFTYAMAEGDGALHNDLFQITEDRLEIKNSFKCADGECYEVRISTTDDGGLSFSKAFKLNLEKVLVKPKADTLTVNICEGETCRFHGMEYDESGFYTYTKDNDYMCDSVYVLNLSVKRPIDAPTISVEGTHTLVSSAAKGNQWFRQDGTPVENATEQEFMPEDDGVYYVAVSNGSCYSEPSPLYDVHLSDQMSLKLDLKAGWNWVSSNLTGTDNQDVMHFLEPIKTITERLVGIDDELINDPVYGLTGGLTTMTPNESYELKVTENKEHIVNGTVSKPENTEMALHEGWNWIGYVPMGGNSLSAAMAGLQPAENDILKCQDDFATYSGGEWIGTLDWMKPGEGYMYYANEPASFHYPAQRVFPVNPNANASRSNRGTAHWNYDAHLYPDNTTMIGRLYANGLPAIEGIYTVGAFCDGECRGVGKYVDGRLFLTIHGLLSERQTITLKAFENTTGQEYDIQESITFDGGQTGTYRNPYALHIGAATALEQVTTSNYAIYPKPLRDRMYVNGDLQQIKTIQILASDGTVCLRQEGCNGEGIDVSHLLPAVYVVAVIQKDGKVYYEKVIKAKNS